jgi:hypothetical protein
MPRDASTQRKSDTLASTPTARIIRLRSPFNGEVFSMEFVPGVPPTLETMLAAAYVRVDDDVKVKPTKAMQSDD